jgi:hypothetical protein
LCFSAWSTSFTYAVCAISYFVLPTIGRLLLFQLSPPNPNYLQNPNYQNAPGLFLLLLFSMLLLSFFPTLTQVRSSLSPPQSLQPPILLQLANTSFTERWFRQTRKKYPNLFPIFFFKSFFFSCSSNLYVIRCKTSLKILSTRVGVARNPLTREIAKSEGRRRWQNPSARWCSCPLNSNVLKPGPKRGPISPCSRLDSPPLQPQRAQTRSQTRSW